MPITISTSADPKAIKQKMLLKDREQEFAIEGVKPDEWIKVLLFSLFNNFVRLLGDDIDSYVDSF